MWKINFNRASGSDTITERRFLRGSFPPEARVAHLNPSRGGESAVRKPEPVVSLLPAQVSRSLRQSARSPRLKATNSAESWVFVSQSSQLTVYFLPPRGSLCLRFLLDLTSSADRTAQSRRPARPPGSWSRSGYGSVSSVGTNISPREQTRGSTPS